MVGRPVAADADVFAVLAASLMAMLVSCLTAASRSSKEPASTPATRLLPLIVRHGHCGTGGSFVARCVGGGIGDGVNAPGLIGSRAFGG